MYLTVDISIFDCLHSILFHFVYESLDADIAALAHSSEERPQPSATMRNTITSLQDIQNYNRLNSVGMIGSVPTTEYHRSIYRGNDSINSPLFGLENTTAMDLSMGGSCLGLDSIDIMNIGTFSHNIDLVAVSARGYPGTTDLDGGKRTIFHQS